MLDPVWFTEEITPLPEAIYPRGVLLLALRRNNKPGAQAVLDVTGGGEILAWDYSPETWPPSWALLRQGNSYELVLSGTEQVKQALIHVSGVLVTATLPPFGGLHNHWRNAWYAVWGAARPFFGATVDRVTLSGHSYGAACCCVGAAMFFAEGAPDGAYWEAVTFGSPRVFYGADQPESGRKIVRVVNDGDPVLLLPPRDAGIALGRALVPGGSLLGLDILWQHSGYRFTFDGPAQVKNWGRIDEAGDIVTWALSDETVSLHLIETYLDKMEDTLRGWYGRKASAGAVPDRGGGAPDG